MVKSTQKYNALLPPYSIKEQFFLHFRKKNIEHLMRDFMITVIPDKVLLLPILSPA